MTAKGTQGPARVIVSIFGGSDDIGRTPAVILLAEQTGRALAELGYVVANGGYGGTMEASARGAKQAGGRTIGVTCSIWKSRPNAYLDEVITTGSRPSGSRHCCNLVPAATWPCRAPTGR